MKNIDLINLLQKQDLELPLLPFSGINGYRFRDLTVSEVYVVTDDQGRPVEVLHTKPDKPHTVALSLE